MGIGTDNPTEQLTVNGKVLAKAFVRRSAAQWKTDIQTLEGSLEKIQSLRGVSYDWKANGKHDIGLIAEEVGEVIPEVVVYEENGENAIGVDYAGLVPVLIEAVKEQQQLLEEKEAQIAALQEDDHEFEARIAALEKSLGAEAKRVQTGLLPFNASLMWMLAGGLGLLLVTPGLVLGYRRFRRDE
ncbi:MAG TPA: tail fiber domain-containing protein [Dehalococcoidia bacterium]|nr:tail fiber domain-containing protein [Dehalococcoidia bacterium]